MTHKIAISDLFLAALFSLFVSLPALGQPQQQIWMWRDAVGGVRSRADLDEVLKQHRLWINSSGKSGARANLSGANLREADLHGADLRQANLSSTDLSGADLSRAALQFADLHGANLNDASLRDAQMNWAILDRVLFEPKELPTVWTMALAKDSDSMTFEYNPSPLTQLRNRFQDAGNREAERAVTCALNRRQARPDYKTPPYKSMQGLFRWIAFDLTCGYGLSPGRPLGILGLLCLLFALAYAVFIHCPGTSGIYLVGSRWSKGRWNTQGLRIRPRTIASTRRWNVPFLWLGREWRVLRAAMFLSLISAFDIGFRDINLGRWLRLLTRREYDLKAIGTARTISGIQKLLSVYLVGLWVVTYFGRPFE